MNSLKTILLAEDNAEDIELTLEALKEYNLANQVVVAKDGVETLEYLRRAGKFKSRRKGNPAVILLDIKMPRMDGIEVLRVIKQDEMLKSIPVVILTSSREEPDLKICYQIGVNAYVVKPVNFMDFLQAIRQIGSFWAILNELPPEQID